MSKERKLPSWITEYVLTVSPELASTSLFRFNVKLQITDEHNKPKTLTVDMLPDLDLDYEILEEQMEQIPGQYAFWSAVFSEVKMGVAVADRKLKMRYGAVVEKIQEESNKNGVKLTAEVIKRIAESDQDVVKADLAYQMAQMQAGKLFHMLEALKMKSELARSLAGFKRNERDYTS
jgi:hypothetical protein